MQKAYFHNGKSINRNMNTKKLPLIGDIDRKKVVDINKLLNRVKIDQRNDTKKKIIFYSFTVVALSIFGSLITILK